MATADPASDPRPTTSALDVVPRLRTDLHRRTIGDSSVVWSPAALEPVALGPVPTLMLDVIDGTATLGELATEVHEEIGIPLLDAQEQLVRIVEIYEGAALLARADARSDDTASKGIASRDPFIGVSTPCSENASRLATESLSLQFGSRVLRVTCDSRRATRVLRTALAEHIVPEEEDHRLGFVFTAPQALKRSHRLTDRAGVVLSETRGLDAGLGALASHLTAFEPAAPGTVRIRAQVLVRDEHTLLCLPPLLYAPAIPVRDITGAGWNVVDRLAIDVDTTTGHMAHRAIPWPELATRKHGPGHVGTGGSRPVSAIAYLSRGHTVSDPAAVAGALAASGTAGTPQELLDAAALLVSHASIHAVLENRAELFALLHELTSQPA